MGPICSICCSTEKEVTFYWAPNMTSAAPELKVNKTLKFTIGAKLPNDLSTGIADLGTVVYKRSSVFASFVKTQSNLFPFFRMHFILYELRCTTDCLGRQKAIS